MYVHTISMYIIYMNISVWFHSILPLWQCDANRQSKMSWNNWLNRLTSPHSQTSLPLLPPFWYNLRRWYCSLVLDTIDMLCHPLYSHNRYMKRLCLCDQNCWIIASGRKSLLENHMIPLLLLSKRILLLYVCVSLCMTSMDWLYLQLLQHSNINLSL